MTLNETESILNSDGLEIICGLAQQIMYRLWHEKVCVSAMMCLAMSLWPMIDSQTRQSPFTPDQRNRSYQTQEQEILLICRHILHCIFQTSFPSNTNLCTLWLQDSQAIDKEHSRVRLRVRRFVESSFRELINAGINRWGVNRSSLESIAWESVAVNQLSRITLWYPNFQKTQKNEFLPLFKVI